MHRLTNGDTGAPLDDRWEHGSDFHLTLEGGEGCYPWGHNAVTLWGSGRDALRALIVHGREQRRWRRLYCPSFYCQDVVLALAREIELVVYAESPLQPATDLPHPGVDELLLVVNVYGMRPRPELVGDGVVIEDHTHDPWSDWAFASQAHYAVVSLRKTLPVPDGGALWSPRSLKLPAERVPTAEHAGACLDRLSAMVLKAHYLGGHGISKDAFRAIAVAGERTMATGREASGVSAFTRARLPGLPTKRWSELRARNRAVLCAALAELRGASVLDTPFAVTLIFDGHGAAERRDRARAALAEARVYAPVIWPLGAGAIAGIPEAHVDLARRVLTLHCDFRYTTDDMLKLAERVRRVCREP